MLGMLGHTPAAVARAHAELARLRARHERLAKTAFKVGPWRFRGNGKRLGIYSSDDRAWMARYLGFNPARPETWPRETIDCLLHLREEQGEEALLREARKLMGP